MTKARCKDCNHEFEFNEGRRELLLCSACNSEHVLINFLDDQDLTEEKGE